MRRGSLLKIVAQVENILRRRAPTVDPSAYGMPVAKNVLLCRILLFDEIINHLKEHFELLAAEFKIAFDGFGLTVSHVRQV